MKKCRKVILAICFLVLFLSTVSAADELDAKTYVEALCIGDAEELTKTYAHTEELLNALKMSGGLGGLQTSLKALGELQEVGAPIIGEVMGYTSYSVPCVFGLQKINLVLNVDGEGRIAGIVTAPYMEGGATQVPENSLEMELSIPVEAQEGWELPGILTLPEGDGPFPAVILVHGSGPNDRDETLGSNKPFRDIARGLTERGIAVYRYDKRTYVYGQEMAQDTALTLEEETMIDAAKAVEILAEQEKIDSDRIYIAGHSLGGQALPGIHDALQENTDAAGYLFLAAPARKMPELMREQYEFLYSLTPELTEEEKQQKQAVFAELDRLEELETLTETDAVLGAYPAYWEYLEKYDPLTEAANITQPCLVMQGEEDYQVTMKDFAIWKEAFEGKENWQFQSYAGLTHLFMQGEKSNGPADYQKEQTVDAQVIEDMAKFILE